MRSARMAPCLSVVLVVLLAALPCLAQEQPPAPVPDQAAAPKKPDTAPADMSLEELMAAVASIGSKLSQLVSDAPAVVSVIPAYEMRGFGWNNLNSVIYAQPGFAPSKDYDRRTVSSRGVFEGWNNNHLLLLVDGVPFNDDLYGTAMTSEITPLTFASSLEILRGPGSALYGSNAMNGAVDIRTISADELPHTISGTVKFGNAETRSVDIIGGAQTAVASFVGSFSGYSTGGNEYLSLDGSRRVDEAGDLLAFRTHDERKSQYFFGKVEGRGGLQGWSLQLHKQDWEFGTGHGWIFYIPDFKEDMNESRTLVALAHRGADKRGWQHDYVLRYQLHEISWNQRYYPNDAVDPYGTTYPAGLWEFLDTEASDLFVRAQESIPMRSSSSLVAGTEISRFQYDGDHEHFSNVNINYGDDYLPVDGNRMKPLRPWLEWVKGNPVLNLAAYAQFSSGSLLGERVTATVGLRHDRQTFDLNALDKPGTPREGKSFSQTSPRLALVYKPTPALTFKALAGRAFRAPSPTEMFGANTYSLASNPRQLEPETATNVELASEWRVTTDVLLRTNLFQNNFENQIAYSVANANLSTNIYSTKSGGMELELLVGTPEDSAFANYSYVRRLDETIIDPTVALSSDKLTWYPSNVANAGYLHNGGRWEASVSGHYQGRVNRRASDRIDPQFALARDSAVGAWFSLDGTFKFQINEHLELGVEAHNALNDRDRMLVKTNDFPFDYRMEGRRVLLTGSFFF